MQQGGFFVLKFTVGRNGGYNWMIFWRQNVGTHPRCVRKEKHRFFPADLGMENWLVLALCGCSYGGRTYLWYVPTVYVVHIIKWWFSERRDTPSVCPKGRT